MILTYQTSPGRPGRASPGVPSIPCVHRRLARSSAPILPTGSRTFPVSPDAGAIELISLNDPGITVLLNSGTRDVYVTDIFLNAPSVGSRTRSLGLQIGAGAFEKVEYPVGEGWRVVTSPEPSFDLSSHFLNSECVYVDFKSETSRGLMQYRTALGDSLATWPAYAEIRYHGADGNEFTLTQDVTVVAIAKYECQSVLEEQGLRQMWID